MKSLLLCLLVGCYVAKYPVTPEAVNESVYLALTATALGTAWVAGPGVAVTAGHVCVDAAMDHDHTVWLTQPGGRTVPAHILVFELSAGPEADVCLLKADGPIGPPLVIAAEEPPPWTADESIGFPRGVYQASHGLYEGAGVTSALADHGSSGGPVFTPRGVYGVVIQLRPDGLPGAAMTLVQEVKNLLDSAGVQYETTPEPLVPADPWMTQG